MNPSASWNVVHDLQQMWSLPFMVNAYRAGSIVALLAALVGYFMIVRKQTFAGHTLSLVGFPGAAGAIWLGMSAVWGYFAFCVGAALVIAAIPTQRASGYHDESAAIGTLQAFALACGFLFASLYGGFANGFNGLLFGSFVGVTDAQVVVLLVVGAAALVIVSAMARPLLFASVDPDVARARGVPVRLLSVTFLVVLGVAVAEASQITGSLLVFALLVAPAATAQIVTARPLLGLGVSIAVGIAITWLGLGLAYYSTYPVGFWITSVAFGAFVAARITRHVAGVAP